jgi:SAM-dependent methyltransferase
VVNVGAGAGSYEPADLRVLTVEPSREMIRQRPAGAAPAVQAAAERLPLRAASFDAALAVLTVHHWSDLAAGLAELTRVARRVVLLTWDPAARDAFWLTTEYLPQIVDLDVPRFPTLDALARHLPVLRVEPVPVPHDCQDGFLGAFWRRPDAYLDPSVRRGMSGFAQLPAGTADAGLARLADDLRTGRWHARFAALARAETADLGYRLIIADTRRSGA